MTTNRSNRYKRTYRALLVTAPLLAIALSARPEPEAISAPQPPHNLPLGSIVAFLPDRNSVDYSDLAGLKRWLRERGWAICDGSEGTPDLNFRMLLGTIHPEEAGQNLGARNHGHAVAGTAESAFGRDSHIRSGVGRAQRIPGDGHKHRLDARSAPTDHLPLSMRVLYIIRVR